MTTTLKEAILLAAEQVGEDGRGENGLAGFLRKIAAAEPKTFAALLGRVLPYHVTEGAPETVFRSVEEIREDLRRRGLPVDRVLSMLVGGTSDDDVL